MSVGCRPGCIDKKGWSRRVECGTLLNRKSSTSEPIAQGYLKVEFLVSKCLSTQTCEDQIISMGVGGECTFVSNINFGGRLGRAKSP